MVFSSIHLDPSNWNQQQNHQIIGSSSANPLLPPPQSHGGGSVRPGSMAERARMANIPLPETSLKCPRCESTNTKFCYFNNYSLSQPRHFCKTCRRYWTRGGALRNVPVGGGCRRNKRTKYSTSTSTSRQTTNASSTTTSTADLGLTPPHLPPLRFMSPLGQFTDNLATDFGAASTNLLGSGGSIEPWRQFSLLGGTVDTSAQGIYQFHGGELGFLGGVKMEESGGNEQWNWSS